MIREIKIDKGKGLVELKLGYGSYLKFNRPLSINWSDRRGSIAQYFAILPYCREYRVKIHDCLTSALNDGEFINNQLFELIEVLLELFESGNYEVSIENEYKYEIGENWNWDLAYNSKLYNSSELIQAQRRKFSQYITEDLEFITENYYDGYSEVLIFTEPLENIDYQRVKYYEQQIQLGRKPIAIVYNGTFNESGLYEDGSRWQKNTLSGNFIIDGHHKLLAYKNLEIAPSLIRITKKFDSKALLNLNTEVIKLDLDNYLYPSQLNHLLGTEYT